jgi:acyl transferase domain-containing protein
VNPELGIAATPFYVNTEAGPWIARLGSVRRAGIDSFGFGGINVPRDRRGSACGGETPADCTPWPAELVVLSAATPATLLEKLDALAVALASTRRRRSLPSPHRSPAPTAASRCVSPCWPGTRRRSPRRPSRRARACGEARAALVAARRCVLTAARPTPAGSRSCSRAKARSTPNNLADLALCFDEVRQWLDFWHSLYDQRAGDNRTDIAFPHASENDEASRKRLDARLHDMDVGSEACSSPAWRCSRCCARSASNPT